jgi:hypothetical protein
MLWKLQTVTKTLRSFIPTNKTTAIAEDTIHGNLPNAQHATENESGCPVPDEDEKQKHHDN